MCCSSPSPKNIACLLLRSAFGLSLLLTGIVHYLSIGDFVGMVNANLGPLTIAGTLWAYILPGLMIVGGGLLTVRFRMDIAAWAAGIALASIAVGSLLRPLFGGIALSDPMAMGSTHSALLWMIVYLFVVKCSGSGGMNVGCCGDIQQDCCGKERKGEECCGGMKDECCGGKGECCGGHGDGKKAAPAASKGGCCSC